MSSIQSAGYEPAPGYRMISRLGAGGFGQVWEAVSPDGTPVALKYIPCKNRPGNVVSNEIRQLLALRECRHPNLIQMHNIFATTNFIIVSMELADGNLADLHDAYVTETGGHIPPDHLCDLLEQAATALDFLAGWRIPGSGFLAGGLQHCDVKPGNLLLVGDCLKVADFGLCTQRQMNNVRSQFAGTPPYAAPEVYQGRLSNRTDQYALAVTYCELRSGGFPFAIPDRFSSSDHQTMPPDLTMLPDRERPLIGRALEIDPSHRWPSCKALVLALRQVVGPTPALVDATTIPILPRQSTRSRKKA